MLSVLRHNKKLNCLKRECRIEKPPAHQQNFLHTGRGQVQSCELTLVDLGHIHAGVVDVQRGLESREELPEESRVLQESRGVRQRRRGRTGSARDVRATGGAAGRLSESAMRRRLLSRSGLWGQTDRRQLNSSTGFREIYVVQQLCVHCVYFLIQKCS